MLLSRAFFFVAVTTAFLFSACTGLEKQNETEPPPTRQGTELTQGQLPGTSPGGTLLEGNRSPEEPEQGFGMAPIDRGPVFRATPPPPSEIISTEVVRNAPAVACFDFILKETPEGAPIPMVVFEEKNGGTRILFFAERSGGVWRKRTLKNLNNIPAETECHFIPAIHYFGDKLYIASRSVNSLHTVFERNRGEWQEWMAVSWDIASVVGGPNLGVIGREGGATIAYKIARDGRLYFVCFNNGNSCGFKETDFSIPEPDRIYFLPWGVSGDPASSGILLRFAGSAENVSGVSLMEFEGGRLIPGRRPLLLPSRLIHPSFSMVPSYFHLALVFSKPATNELAMCTYQNNGARLGCEDLGFSGEEPSIALANEGFAAVGFFNGSRIRLSKRDSADGPWETQTVAQGSGLGKRSIVKAAAERGVLQTHIVYTQEELRYVRIP